MLRTLSICNYAIIDQLEVSFSKGLNIITGETGAGKSILLGAMGLILGERSDSTVLLDTQRKCVVEGCFDINSNAVLEKFLAENNLDDHAELIVRREIAPAGKSRAFINDTPVNLLVLKQLSALLVDLHLQFDTQELGDTLFQLEVLDAIAGNQQMLDEYNTHYRQYLAYQQETSGLRKKQEEANRQKDYNQFLYDELETAGLKDNLLEEADTELKLLVNSEELKSGLGEVRFLLDESENPIVHQIRQLEQRLQSLKSYLPAIEAEATRLNAVYVELQDIAQDLGRLDDTLRQDPARLQVLNDLIATGYRLFKKHGVQNTGQLIAIRDRLGAELGLIIQLDDKIAELEMAAGREYDCCVQIGKKLSANRKKAAIWLTKEVNSLLVQVGMPGASLKVVCEEQLPGNKGCDKVDFLFDANKTGRYEPLQKVASGGERSRLMLCIKSLVAAQLQMPTLIFDEIDTGISGEAARQVGLVLQTLSNNHQVITITHQPQIAAKALRHLFVYKSEKQGQLRTAIRALNIDERVDAIARMLGGERPSEITLQNAREMVEGSV